MKRSRVALFILGTLIGVSGCSDSETGVVASPAPTMLSEEEQNETRFYEVFTSMAEQNEEDAASWDEQKALKEAYQLCSALERGDATENSTVSYYMDYIWDGMANSQMAVVMLGYPELCPDWYKG